MRTNLSCIIFSLSHSLSEDWDFWILKFWNISNRQEFARHFCLLNNLYFCYLPIWSLSPAVWTRQLTFSSTALFHWKRRWGLSAHFWPVRAADRMDISAWDSSQPGPGTVTIQKSSDMSCLDGWVGAILGTQTSHFCSSVHYEEDLL